MPNKQNRASELFKKLTALFKSGPVIRRKIKNIDTAVALPDKNKSSGALLFQKSLSPSFSALNSQAYNISERLARYEDFQNMEYCLAGETLIASPDGFVRIDELAKKCQENSDYQFIVYSYNHENKQIVPAFGKQARRTRFDHAWKVKFDSGKELIGTSNHRLMLRDGTYVKIEDLQVGMAMMPFYRKDLFEKAKKGTKGYHWIYTMNSKNKGWTKEHQLIAQWVAGRELTDDECVHHLNFQKKDNNPENLKIMTKSDHSAFHAKINFKKWSEENKEWVKQFRIKHSLFMKENNPASRKDITFGRILETCERIGFNLNSLCEAFDTDPNVIKRHLRKNCFQNFETFAKAYNFNWKNNGQNNVGNKNPRYDHSLTFENICSSFEKEYSLDDLSKALNTTYTKINNRLKQAGYQSYNDFKLNYENHKVVSIEYFGEIPLYDLTVDGYKNFATDSVISHNTPEIATALNIYSDESCASDEKGRVLHIFSENEKIKNLLEELFIDTLNVEFNLPCWTRSLVKFGDLFLYNDVSPDFGVLNVFPIPVNEVEREENYDPMDPFAVRYNWVTTNKKLQNWEVSHFRLLSNDMFLPYGSSLIEPARRIWRQLTLLEDSMLVYRVVRAPERRVFYIDVGNLPAEDIPNYIEQQKQKLRNSSVIDQNTGRIDLRYNPLCISLKSLIKLQDNRILSLKEIINEWENGKRDQWVYSVDNENKCIVPGKIIWAGVTRKSAELVRIHLDDGTYLDTTPDHQFMLRDGSYQRADQLLENQSLMPLYRQETSKKDGHKIEGYEKIYNPFSQVYSLTHRNNLISTQGFEKIKGKVVHHKDFNKLNNSPENLEALTWVDHCKLHGDLVITYNKSEIGRNNSRKNLKNQWKYGKINSNQFVQMWKDPKIRAKRINKLTLQIDQVFVDHCFRILDQINLGLSTREKDFTDRLNSDEQFVSYLKNNNPDFKNGVFYMTRSGLQSRLKKLGFEKSLESLKRAWLLSRFDINEIKKFCLSIENCNRKIVLEHFNLKRGSFQEIIKLSGENYSEFSDQYLPGAAKYKSYKNHKVVKIEKLLYTEDTGCITVEKYHNFAVGKEIVNQDGDIEHSFVFVKNSTEEDYFIPVHGGDSGTKIDTLSGGQNTGNVEDVAYLQKKLFSALKIPRAYLGYEENLSSKASLAQLDIRFSRSVNVIQRTIISEFNKLAIIHLYANGFSGEDLLNFSLKLSNPSTVAQQQKLELWRAKFEIAGSAPNGFASKKFIYKNIWDISDNDISDIEDERLKELNFDARLEAIATSIAAEAENSGGGGGGDLFGGAEGETSSGSEDALDFDTEGDSDAETEPVEDDGAAEENGGPLEDEDGSQLLISSNSNSAEEFTLPNMPSSSKKPVQLAKYLYNKNRSRTHGASQTHMPDLYAMTTNSEPHDTVFNPFDVNQFKHDTNSLKEENISKPIMTKDIRKILNRLKEIKDNKSSNLMIEGIDIQDQIDRQIISETLLSDENDEDQNFSQEIDI